MKIKKSELFGIIKEVVNNIFEQYNSTDELSKKYKYQGEVFVAYNSSYWQWEYDINIKHAFLYLNNVNKSLRLAIVEETIKSGLGKGRWDKLLQEAEVGNSTKPALSQIRSMLKAYGHDRTRGGGPFPKEWQNPVTNYAKMHLVSILKNY